MDERTNQIMHTAMGAGFSTAFIDDFGDGSLEHYGVTGMKWYQNIFGEPDDRAAYANGGKGKNQTDKPKRALLDFKGRKADKAKAERVRKMQEGAAKARAAKKQAKEDAEVREALKKEYLKDPRKVVAHKDMFTTDELRSAIDRYRIENDLMDISAKRYPKAKSTVDSVVDVVSKGANILDTGARLTKNGATFYNNVATIYNSFVKPPNKPMPTIGSNKKEAKERTPEEIRKQKADALAAELKVEQEKDKRDWAREDRVKGKR